VGVVYTIMYFRLKYVVLYLLDTNDMLPLLVSWHFGAGLFSRKSLVVIEKAKER
jgi:hypothetical protein